MALAERTVAPQRGVHTMFLKGKTSRRFRCFLAALLALVLCGLLGIGFVWLRQHERTLLEERVVAESATAVGNYVASVEPQLGKFQASHGSGHEGPAPFSPAGFYLVAYRTLAFENGIREVRINVFPSDPARKQLQPRVTPVNQPGREYSVEHPDLTPR